MSYSFLKDLGIKDVNSGGCAGIEMWTPQENRELLDVISPINNERIAQVALVNDDDYDFILSKTKEQFNDWQMYPSPKRGEIIRQLSEAFREKKDQLGSLITLEMGKILAEGKGEIQEVIDIGDFAVGLSRQLYGLTMHSERANHRMYEQWHPLGIVGVITAFNFPAAVWSWNTMIAAVCGNVCVWKPSSKTPLTAIAIQHIVNDVFNKNGFPSVMSLLIGSGRTIGDKLVHDSNVPLISMTGSTKMGRHVSTAVAKRLGRSILELGGNNGVIVMNDANLDLAVRAILFGAVGTAGQRCTSTRRVFAHADISQNLLEMLISAYKQLSIGDPLAEKTLVGPLIDKNAIKEMMNAVDLAKKEGGEVVVGGGVHDSSIPGNYVQPTIIKMKGQSNIVKEETFAPLLYFIEVDSLEDGIRQHNDVPQGLSSSIFTESMRNMEYFLSHIGSDCGIANVNIGTSGAEIGGAFGGEKDTGGGREAGSDSWKFYMRRQTNTINWGSDLPLAQGIQFDLNR